ARANVVDVDLHPAARTRQQVGQEDVRIFQQPVEDSDALLLMQIERDAALAAVVVLPGEIKPARAGGEAADFQAADGIAAGRLYFRDRRAEVGQDAAGSRDERPHGHLDHFDAFKRPGHVPSCQSKAREPLGSTLRTVYRYTEQNVN